MNLRNRAEGWKHAKLSGHENEALLKKMLEAGNAELLKVLGVAREEIASVDIGGLCESSVPSVLGDKTKSKTDCVLVIGDKTKNISLKKGNGQVYLITVDRFIRGYEKQYSVIIPDTVKRGIALYFGTADDTLSIVASHGVNKTYETRKNRLTGDSLRAYDKTIYDTLLNWFIQNAVNVFDFCFSRGLASNSADYAEVIWYYNALGENDNNDLYDIKTLKASIAKKPTATYGMRGGGTTIQLPFGFLQWHSPTKTIPGCMQFHHQYEKIKTLFDMRMTSH